MSDQGGTGSQDPDADGSREPVHAGRLIAVLASSFPLAPALARWLYETAVELHASGEGQFRVAGDLGDGVVRNLKEEALLGIIGGPLFEATLETGSGAGLVRFLVTREGLARHESAARLRRTLVN